MEQAIRDLEWAIAGVHRLAARLSEAGDPEAYTALRTAVALTDAINDLKVGMAKNNEMLREILETVQGLNDAFDARVRGDYDYAKGT